MRQRGGPVIDNGRPWQRSQFVVRRLWPSLALCLIGLAAQAWGYSVLTHEALIDTTWDGDIKPLLVQRFPGTTDEQLREAHAYAYGGAIIQDMGYYPLGNKFFSDLVHYTRSGDFVIALLRQAQDPNEYAFALGALAHYAADNEGHPIGVNRAVPLLYPKLALKFGREVVYEDDPGAHLKTEFAFDVVEVARGKYASETYHDFVGFKVSKPVLERAFSEIYSLEMKDLFRTLDLALGTYRYTVSEVIPEMSKTAWSAKKGEIQKLQAGITQNKYVYRVDRASYRKEWTEPYSRPGAGARFLSFVFRIIPKVGPFKGLGFRVPTPEAEQYFLKSFDATLQRYRSLLAEVRQNRLSLPNQNFDTGRPTRLGDYRKADEAYCKLLENLAKGKNVSPQLRANIMAFYGASPGPDSEKARTELTALRTNE
jgi:hypothetical protein